MGLFRRRTQSDDAPDNGEIEPDRDGVTGGPFDISDEPDLGGRIDLGALRIPAVKGMQLRVALDGKQRIAVAATLGLNGSTVQLQVLAAPKTQSLWQQLRPVLQQSFEARGGTCSVIEGRFGSELHADVPITAKGGSGRSSIRLVGIDGPRWLLRAVITGPAALPGPAADHVDELISRVVVNRGKEARPPREVVPLTVPGVPSGQGETDADPLSLLQRGPELTETR